MLARVWVFVLAFSHRSPKCVPCGVLNLTVHACLTSPLQRALRLAMRLVHEDISDNEVMRQIYARNVIRRWVEKHVARRRASAVAAPASPQQQPTAAQHSSQEPFQQQAQLDQVAVEILPG